MTNDRRLAHALFRRFRMLPDSEQIATAFALRGLLRWTRRVRPSRIYEIGVGLGTLSEALWVAAPLAIWTGVERQPAFRALNRPGVVDSIRPGGPIDMLVGDDTLNSEEAAILVNRLTNRAVWYFEGNRGAERRAAAGALRRAGRRWSEANWRSLDRSKGFWIFQLDPTRWECAWFALRRAWEHGLDRLLCPLLGVKPGWRRRDFDPNA